MGATGVTGRGIVGTEGTEAVGMAETGTESAAGAGATGEAGAVIPSPATISGPLEVSASGEMSMQTKRKYKRREDEEEERYIPIKSGPDEALPSSSESKTVLFNTGTSSGSSKMSADPSEDKSRSGPWVAEPGMEEGVTTSEALPFVA